MADPKVQGPALLEKLRAMQIASEKGQTLEGMAGRGSEANKMSGRYIEGDPGDDSAKIKGELATPNRPAPITDSDVAMVQRKLASVEVAKYDQWFQNTWDFNSGNPVMQRWAQGANSAYFERRERVIDEQAQLQVAIAKLKLRGVRSEDDLKLLYAIQMGVVKADKEPLWEIGGKDLSQADIRQGLFNPRRLKIGAMNARWPSAGFKPLQGMPGLGGQPSAFAADNAGAQFRDFAGVIP